MLVDQLVAFLIAVFPTSQRGVGRMLEGSATIYLVTGPTPTRRTPRRSRSHPQHALRSCGGARGRRGQTRMPGRRRARRRAARPRPRSVTSCAARPRLPTRRAAACRARCRRLRALGRRHTPLTCLPPTCG
ncbi:hypothetical protein T492DRAFT_1029172 [Pavlovales sp. CCMP2436]|nr:hypothetical protein T492DRAFT_1029172 [Pavlovales sp. CCMP2436]